MKVNIILLLIVFKNIFSGGCFSRCSESEDNNGCFKKQQFFVVLDGLSYSEFYDFHQTTVAQYKRYLNSSDEETKKIRRAFSLLGDYLYSRPGRFKVAKKFRLSDYAIQKKREGG